MSATFGARCRKQPTNFHSKQVYNGFRNDHIYGPYPCVENIRSFDKSTTRLHSISSQTRHGNLIGRSRDNKIKLRNGIKGQQNKTYCSHFSLIQITSKRHKHINPNNHHFNCVQMVITPMSRQLPWQAP